MEVRRKSGKRKEGVRIGDERTAREDRGQKRRGEEDWRVKIRDAREAKARGKQGGGKEERREG